MVRTSPAFLIPQSRLSHTNHLSNRHFQNEFSGIEPQLMNFDISEKKFKTLFLIKSLKMKKKPILKRTNKRRKKLKYFHFNLFVVGFLIR
jgi:hypothetical protein